MFISGGLFLLIGLFLFLIGRGGLALTCFAIALCLAIF